MLVDHIPKLYIVIFAYGTKPVRLVVYSHILPKFDMIDMMYICMYIRYTHLLTYTYIMYIPEEPFVYMYIYILYGDVNMEM